MITLKLHLHIIVHFKNKMHWTKLEYIQADSHYM
jgi:hypothetical protein